MKQITMVWTCDTEVLIIYSLALGRCTTNRYSVVQNGRMIGKMNKAGCGWKRLWSIYVYYPCSCLDGNRDEIHWQLAAHDFLSWWGVGSIVSLPSQINKQTVVYRVLWENMKSVEWLPDVTDHYQSGTNWHCITRNFDLPNVSALYRCVSSLVDGSRVSLCKCF